MEDLPMTGDLREYTFEAETRPMPYLEPSVLGRLQMASRAHPQMSDPVFGLDETTGTVTAVFQLWAATAALAVALGSWLFVGCLVASNATRSLDCVESLGATALDDDEAECGDLIPLRLLGG